jgi:hypothetical protein
MLARDRCDRHHANRTAPLPRCAKHGQARAAADWRFGRTLVLRRISFGLLLLLLLAPAPPAAADDFGVTFQPPPGWSPVPVQDSRAFSPPGLPPGTFMLLIVSHADTLAAQTFRAWYDRQLSLADLQIVERGEIMEGTAHGLQFLVTTQMAQDPQAGRIQVLFYGISSGRQAALAIMMTNSGALTQRHMPAVRAFFDSLDFAAAVAAPAAPETPAAPPVPIPPAAVGDGGPQGLFYFVRVTGIQQLQVEARIFLPGNRVLRFFPDDGGDQADLTVCATVPDQCGTYQLEGATMRIRWDSGAAQQLAFARTEKGFSLDGDEFKPARPTSAAALVGAWSTISGNRVRFDGDGHYQWGAGEVGGVNLAGTYELHGLTLALHRSDGVVESHTLFATGDRGEAVCLDGNWYVRE